MADFGGLQERFATIAKEILRIAKQGKKILVVTHLDADGLTSGSIAFAALSRKGADVTVRSVADLDLKTVEDLKAQGFDYYIFTDLGSSLVKELEEAFDGHFLQIDHHQLAESDLAHPSVINAWQFGFDGGTEGCSATMAYFFAASIDEENVDLSPLAVVGAVADRQDAGPGRSLTGLNLKAKEDAQAAGLLSVSKDLLFNGRETRPVHESVALTSSPYLPGLSGSRDAVLAALLQAGLQIREAGRWRTISELTADEKMKLTEVIASTLQPGEGSSDLISNLIGEVYTLETEDSFTPLRDAREFATLLNACGRMDSAGVGMAVCLGDRRDALKSAMETLSEYRSSIAKAMEGISADKSRVEDRGKVVMLRGDGLVGERLLGPVASIFNSSPGYKDRVVVARTDSGEKELKISSRVGDEFRGDVNLGLIMREAAEEVGGVGGGHNRAAGAKIPTSAGDAFSKIVLEKIGA